MKFASLGAIVFSLLSAVASVGVGPARGASASEYVIAANDGYGLQECLGAGGECGKVVADAWCEAHGHVHALSFGARGAMSGGATSVAAAADESYVIECGD